MNKLFFTLATIFILLIGVCIIATILWLLGIHSTALSFFLSGIWGYCVTNWYLDTKIITMDKPVDIIPDPEPFFAIHKKWSVVYTKGKTMEEVIDKLEKDNESLDDFIICKYQDEKIYMYKVHKEITKGNK